MPPDVRLVIWSLAPLGALAVAWMGAGTLAVRLEIPAIREIISVRKMAARRVKASGYLKSAPTGKAGSRPKHWPCLDKMLR